MNSQSVFLHCPSCNQLYNLKKPRWRCDCGHYLLLNVEFEFSKKDIIEKDNSFFRYQATLPFLTKKISIGEALTPLAKTTIDERKCELKLDYLLPTGSYKDRGISIMISVIKQWEINKIVEDSSGNAGSAVAAYSSKAGVDCDVYIPSYTSYGKAAQIELYGANLIKIKGSREDTADAAFHAGEKSFYASHNWSPFFEHGIKTYIYEIWEQRNYNLPDMIIVPCGNGSLVTSAYVAFNEMIRNNLIEKMPKIIAVQSESCAPLAKAFEKGLKIPVKVDKRSNLAEGISSASPLKGKEILEAVYKTNGIFATVSDIEIWESLQKLAKQGIFIEPTSATATAAFSKLNKNKYFRDDEDVVILLTGHGLKAVDKILKLVKKNRVGGK